MQKKQIFKVVVPILMIAVVAGIWFVQKDKEAQMSNPSDVPVDFALHTSSIDLPALKEYELPTIIDFGATECIPCKAMAPVLVTLNEEFQERAIIKFVDVWVSPSAADGYPVQVIPTQVFYNADGTPYFPSDEVLSSIQFQMYKDQNTDEHIFTAHQGGLTEDQLRMIFADMGVDAHD